MQAKSEQDSDVEILSNQSVPSLRWRHYTLTAELARKWATQLWDAAVEADRRFSLEEAARDSKRDR